MKSQRTLIRGEGNYILTMRKDKRIKLKSQGDFSPYYILLVGKGSTSLTEASHYESVLQTIEPQSLVTRVGSK